MAQLIVYPDAHTETSTVDGATSHYVDNSTWSTLVNGAGNGFNDTNTEDKLFQFQCGTNSNTWYGIVRSHFLFDTSSLTTNAVISAATISFRGTAKANGMAVASSKAELRVVSSSQSNNTSLSNASYTALGSTTLGSLAYDSFSTSTYNDITLNETGRSNINRTGISKFATRGAGDVDNNVTEYVGGYQWCHVTARFADYSGTTDDPKLTIDYDEYTTTSFTSAGTTSWNVPTGVTSVIVEAIGGGAGGGRSRGNPSTGGGGGGGAYSRKVVTVTPADSLTVVVGSGGSGSTGTGTDTQHGTAGGDSYFIDTSTVLAKGGSRGLSDGNVNSSNGAGGAGGLASAGVGDIKYDGGTGGTGVFTSSTGYSGAGGGGAGSSGAGGTPVAGTGGVGSFEFGGNGANGVGNNTAGGVGSTAGGGGSGGKSNTTTDRNGGAGAAGRINLYWIASAGNDLMETLEDNFNDNSINATIWNNWGGGNVVETSQQLEITGGTTAWEYFGIDSQNSYNLTGSSVFTEVVSIGTQDSSWSVYPLLLTLDATNSFYWLIENDYVMVWKRVANTYTQIGSGFSYNSTNHRWFRIREAGGTTYYDTSADGSSWTNYTSQANAMAVTALKCSYLVGNTGAVSPARKFIVDNLNIEQAGVSRRIFFIT